MPSPKNDRLSGSACPVTGLPLLRRPEWTALSFGLEGYAATFTAIGGEIVHGSPCGYSPLEATKAYLVTLETIFDTLRSPDGRYVMIEDFTGLTGAAIRARNHYAQKQRRNPRLKAVIFYGLSPMFHTIVTLAVKLVQPPFPVLAEKSYEEAMRRAQQVLAEPPQKIRKTVEVARMPIQEVEEKVSTLLETMASINWETLGNGFDRKAVSAEDPFFPLFEAVSLLKEDFDAILRNQRESQEALKKSEEQLRHHEKMRAIGLLAGGVAHDFNNMLQGIVGFAELIRTQCGDDRPDLRRFAENILDSARTATSLSSSLLGFAAKRRMESKPVDIHSEIRSLAEILGRTLDRRISLRLDLPASRSVVSGDPAQLQSAILNLCLNASEAMPEGGELRVSTGIEDGTTTRDIAFILAPPRESCIRITVADQGIGMDDEVLQRIFEPFYTTKPQGHGTGLGLSGVYGIVQAHKGGLKVESSPGCGSAFHLYLPLSARNAIPEPETPPAPAVAVHGRVLIVEDEPRIRELLELLCGRMGYSSLAAEDGASGVELYRARHADIDLVILDVQLPGLYGSECFAEMKRINPDCRVLVISGYARGDAVQRMKDQGAHGFLQKPFHANDFSRALHEALNQ